MCLKCNFCVMCTLQFCCWWAAHLSSRGPDGLQEFPGNVQILALAHEAEAEEVDLNLLGDGRDDLLVVLGEDGQVVLDVLQRVGGALGVEDGQQAVQLRAVARGADHLIALHLIHLRMQLSSVRELCHSCPTQLLMYLDCLTCACSPSALNSDAYKLLIPGYIRMQLILATTLIESVCRSARSPLACIIYIHCQLVPGGCCSAQSVTRWTKLAVLDDRGLKAHKIQERHVPPSSSVYMYSQLTPNGRCSGCSEGRV